MFTLAWKYIRYNKLISGLLICGLTLVIAFPLVAWRSIQWAEGQYGGRAEATPLLFGRKANPYALVIKTLYFQGRSPPTVPFEQITNLLDNKSCITVPLYIPSKAGGLPVVGVGFEYFAQRKLHIQSGALPALLGDCVLGSAAANVFKLKPDDPLTTDTSSFLNIAHKFPFKLRVTGVLAATGGPDDRAIFVDIKSAWVMDGLGHGHENKAQENDASAADINLKTSDPAVIDEHVKRVLGSDLNTFQSVTEKNIHSFHFHEAMDTFPIHGALLWPDSPKAGTLLKASIQNKEDVALIVPTEIIGDLMKIIFNVKKIFEGYFAMIVMATATFLAIIVLLSLRARQKEFALMARMGCSSQSIFTIFFYQFLILFSISVGLSAIISQACTWALPKYFL